MLPLSAIVTTYNEEANIGQALESLAWIDDILVVDSFSQDNTVDIARKYTDRVVQRAYAGPADQKNWAIPRARHEWVLLLDADERVTPPMQKEIEALLEQGMEEDAYWVGRQSYFMGKPVRYSGWQHDAVIRLFRRDRCRYDTVQVHEEIITTGLRIGRLRAKLDHYTYRDLQHFLEKIDRYAQWSAQDHASTTGHIGFFHLLVKPLFRFFKHFVWQRGFADGRVGLIISALMAWGVFLRYAYLLDSRSNPPLTTLSTKSTSNDTPRTHRHCRTRPE